jgi:hypothetical protein
VRRIIDGHRDRGLDVIGRRTRHMDRRIVPLTIRVVLRVEGVLREVESSDQHPTLAAMGEGRDLRVVRRAGPPLVALEEDADPARRIGSGDDALAGGACRRVPHGLSPTSWPGVRAGCLWGPAIPRLLGPPPACQVRGDRAVILR